MSPSELDVKNVLKINHFVMRLYKNYFYMKTWGSHNILFNNTYRFPLGIRITISKRF